MEPILKEFLDKKQAEQRKEFESERDQLLVSLGLVKFEKEYSPSGKQTGPYVKYDVGTKNYYYVKHKTPIEVTDEEYEQIKKYALTQKPQKPQKLQKLQTLQKSNEVDGTEWGLKLVNGVFWVLAIIGFVIVIFLASDALFNDELLKRANSAVQEQVVLQMQTLTINVGLLVALGVMSIGLCFLAKLLLKIIKNQNEIKAKMK